jgi:putative glycosyltransferase (TIGR04348 family)
LKIANNGNWQTAYRWSRFLRSEAEVSIASAWPATTDRALAPDCMIALHARRSAASIARFAAAHPQRPLIVILTGTDLYRDIRADPEAQRSLDLATHLVVLQESGLAELSARHRAKCRVIYQSAPTLLPGKPNRRTFDAVLVGHMRAEKDPLTPMRAVELLPPDSRVRLVHIGNAGDERFGRAATELQARNRRYLWLGGLPHGRTRQWIRRAQLRVISSLMEGGANVIIEAVTAGVPVLASKVSGNVGMLGRDYAGYFGVSDSQALADLLERAARDEGFLALLRRQCAGRSSRFAPERERAEVIKLVRSAMKPGR